MRGTGKLDSLELVNACSFFFGIVVDFHYLKEEEIFFLAGYMIYSLISLVN